MQQNRRRQAAPRSLAEHLGASPNYTIDATWMARVDTVVNYALTAGLNVIINLHHDGADGVTNIQWLGIEMYGSTMWYLDTTRTSTTRWRGSC